jgi:cold shock protein
MKKGKVKFFNTQKHFGFITLDETGEQVFVHQSGLKTEINENDKVVFELKEGPKGLHAVNVCLDEQV